MILYRSIGPVCIVFATCSLPVRIATPAHERDFESDIEHLQSQSYQSPSRTSEHGPDFRSTSLHAPPRIPQDTANDLLNEPSVISRKRKADVPLQAERSGSSTTRSPEGLGELKLGELGFSQHSNLPHSGALSKSGGQLHTTNIATSSRSGAIDFAEGLVMLPDLEDMRASQIERLILKHCSGRLEKLFGNHWKACSIPRVPTRLESRGVLPEAFGHYLSTGGKSCLRMRVKKGSMSKESSFTRIRKVFELFWLNNSMILPSKIPEDEGTLYLPAYIEEQNKSWQWLWKTLTLPDDSGSQPVLGFTIPGKDLVFGKAQDKLLHCLSNGVMGKDAIYNRFAQDLVDIYHEKKEK